MSKKDKKTDRPQWLTKLILESDLAAQGMQSAMKFMETSSIPDEPLPPDELEDDEILRERYSNDTLVHIVSVPTRAVQVFVSAIEKGYIPGAEIEPGYTVEATLFYNTRAAIQESGLTQLAVYKYPAPAGEYTALLFTDANGNTIERTFDQSLSDEQKVQMYECFRSKFITV